MVPAGDAFDKALEAALATPDRAEATKQAATAIRIAVDDEEVVVVPMAGTYWLFAMNTQITGFVLHGSARHVRWAGVSW